MGLRKVDRWEARPLADSVLHLIWRKKQISRAEIARQIGLSRSTVTEVVKDLLNTGYVKEVGAGVSSGGRKPIVLEFQNDHKLILGIDIGATHVSASLMDIGSLIMTPSVTPLLPAAVMTFGHWGRWDVVRRILRCR